MRFTFFLLLAALSLVQGCATAGASSGPRAAADDRRSAGTLVEDNTIESKAQQRIEEKHKDMVHVSVTAYNRFALITGSAASETIKMDIERIVGSIPNVKGIANELQVGVVTTREVHSNDSTINNNIKYRFQHSKDFQPEHVKYVTENGVVYLMGLVTRAEANIASEIAATTKGVQKVVRVFEYID